LGLKIKRSQPSAAPTGAIFWSARHIRAIAPNHFPASPDFGAVLPQATEESASAAGWHKSCALL